MSSEGSSSPAIAFMDSMDQLPLRVNEKTKNHHFNSGSSWFNRKRFTRRCLLGLLFNVVTVPFAMWSLANFILSLVFPLMSNKMIQFSTMQIESIVANGMIFLSIILNFIVFVSENVGNQFFRTPAYFAHWGSAGMFVWGIVANVAMTLSMFWLKSSAYIVTILVIVAAALILTWFIFVCIVLWYWMLKDLWNGAKQRMADQWNQHFLLQDMNIQQPEEALYYKQQ